MIVGWIICTSIGCRIKEWIHCHTSTYIRARISSNQHALLVVLQPGVVKQDNQPHDEKRQHNRHNNAGGG
jgi:hypothetical protein